MAKEKLFTPEDFDKPTAPKGNIWKKIFIGVSCVAVIGLATWGIISLTAEKKESLPNNPQKEIPVQTKDSIVSVVESTETTEQENAVQETTESTESETVQEPQIQQQVSDVTDDIETEAMKVIRGDYGNVPQRRQLLGKSYQSIQDRVNQLKKEGLF